MDNKIKEELQKLLNNRPLTRVEIGERGSLSLGFGCENKNKFMFSNLRPYKELETGTYRKNWKLTKNGSKENATKIEICSDDFHHLIGECAKINNTANSILLVFESGEVEFLLTKENDEDFHIFTPERDCWEWKYGKWTLHKTS